jgi:Uma2 family endonuclease
MPVATRISKEEYLSTSYRPDCDFVDGEVVERNVGEFDHGRLQGLTFSYLLSREKLWGLRVVLEQRVQVKPERFRIPDVCVVLAGKPIQQVFTDPPFLCIEVLSPADRMSRVQERIDDYLSMGVPHVWVIDPESRRGYHYTSEGMREAKDGVLRTAEPPIEVPIAELFD